MPPGNAAVRPADDGPVDCQPPGLAFAAAGLVDPNGSIGDVQAALPRDDRPVERGSACADEPTLRRGVAFAAVNALLAYHLLAITIAPATIPPSSELQRLAFLGVESYLNALSLNHGYHYFAPDPGESLLVEYRGRNADGQLVTGRLPDKAIQPRLLYHRYFMLTESQPRDGDDPRQAALHRQAIRRGIEKHTGLRDLEIVRLRHRLATPRLIRAGLRLDDAGQYDREPFAPPPSPALPNLPTHATDASDGEPLPEPSP